MHDSSCLLISGSCLFADRGNFSALPSTCSHPVVVSFFVYEIFRCRFVIMTLMFCDFRLMYLLESYKGTEKIMGVILSAAYIVAKGSDILQRVKFLKRSFIKFLQKTVSSGIFSATLKFNFSLTYFQSFGTTPTKEQIQAAGGTCPICHDNYQDAVILNECNHIFCELCLLGWLDRENNTCPLCRAKIDQDNPGYRDGSTTFFIQFY
jgi:Zinc finger, C3HC4 type (RING finger)